MKRILLLLLLVAVACGKESAVSTGNASTFVRYFNGGNNDVAQAIVQTSDMGLLILATTEIKPSELASSHYRIKLIKTDQNGNLLWQKMYPDFNPVPEYEAGGIYDTASFKAGGLYVTDSVIVIAATHILQKNGMPNAMVIAADADGNNPRQFTIPSPSPTNGTAVNLKYRKKLANGKVLVDFLVLGTITDEAILNNMVLSRISSTTDSLLWSKSFGSSTAGQVTLANRLYLASGPGFEAGAFWGGTVNRSGTTSIRLVAVRVDPTNEGGLITDPPIGSPAYTTQGNDFCSFGQTWAFVGTSNENGNFDLLLERVDQTNGTTLSHQLFKLSGDGAGQNAIGNSICTTDDGGLLLLGTVNSQGSFGRGGKDYYLIKTNAFGDTDWAELQGSKFDDNGVQVIQAKDGGYVVLGTTTLANVKTIMLMKTGKDGKIQ